MNPYYEIAFLSFELPRAAFDQESCKDQSPWLIGRVCVCVCV